MRVILLSDVKHWGRRGEEVEVRQGFARNYLIPQGMALEANDPNRSFFEQQRKKIELKAQHEREAATAIAEEIAGVKIAIGKRAGATETLYGSVTSSEVAEALEAKGFIIDRRRIDLGGGIKTLGEHKITISLHTDVEVELDLTVTAEE
jgi:large subunit ribosomal protein L9